MPGFSYRLSPISSFEPFSWSSFRTGTSRFFVDSLTGLLSFQGMAIGNGYLNVKNLTNSLVHWHHYHGSIGVRFGGV